jgi:hypothetical protein
VCMAVHDNIIERHICTSGWAVSKWSLKEITDATAAPCRQHLCLQKMLHLNAVNKSEHTCQTKTNYWFILLQCPRRTHPLCSFSPTRVAHEAILSAQPFLPAWLSCSLPLGDRLQQFAEDLRS